ncbi:hypothetical protein K402DRAFT_305097, partial [Aulographum hederae CBS 113979]
YIVVGVINRRTGVPTEHLVANIPPEGLFKAIRKAAHHCRPWWHRALSLKTVKDFHMYQCNKHKGYHHDVELDAAGRGVLSELWQDYQSQKADYGDRWMRWIDAEFNRGDREEGGKEGEGLPEAWGSYSLQLVLHWDTVKIGVWGAMPVLLSLAVGFWYGSLEGDDPNSIVQTAWTLSSYIVSTAS